jgi:hypothetical protein
MNVNHPPESRAVHRALSDLVAALTRTHWAADQSMSEFMGELDDAMAVLESIESQAAA